MKDDFNYLKNHRLVNEKVIFFVNLFIYLFIYFPNLLFSSSVKVSTLIMQLAFPFSFFCCLFLLLFSTPSSFCEEIHISNADGLIDISNNAKNNVDYSGTTVILDSDIDFTGKSIEPINTFYGSFDGNGYTIKGLQVSSSLRYVGLFGSFGGNFIKNLILDSSCSIVSSSSESDNFVGGVIGYCISDVNNITVENIVSNASVAFSGSTTKDMHIGGIVGVVDSMNNHEISVKSCINYGTVTHGGNVEGYCSIGGVVGHFVNGTKYIQNCFNYGTVHHAGTTSGYKFIGGILGAVITNDKNSDKAVIENCLSAGEIKFDGSADNVKMGSILGISNGWDNDVSIIHCYWTKDTKCDVSYGDNDLKQKITNTSQAELNETTLNDINEYAKQHGETQTKYFTLHLNGGEINGIKQDTMVVAQNNFPTPVKEGNTFLKWCEDICCDVAYDPKASNATELYAIWNTNILTLDFNNGTVINRTLQFNENIVYPENISMDGHIFKGWEPQIDKMRGCEIVSVAQWDTVPSISSISEFIASTKFVEIVFSKKDLTEEEVKEIISEYVNDDSFVIERFGVDESTGKLVTIIKFKDKETAENFVENISVTSKFKDSIGSINYLSDIAESFSFGVFPSLFSFVF